MLKAFKKTVEEGVFTFIIGMHHIKNMIAGLFLTNDFHFFGYYLVQVIVLLLIENSAFCPEVHAHLL